ncbi:MAG TPA: cytochrome P450 [Acidimicrobiia bacterium]|nr:cytochrome P450 [Acidimicrobiia bacterium]
MSDVRSDVHDEEYDPFAVFDQSTGAGSVRDPYPVFHELRAECPVQAGAVASRFEWDQSVDPMLADPEGTYTPLSFEAVQAVLKDGEAFSSSAYADSMGLVMGHSILEMDEPEHHRYRSLIQQAFTRKAMERWESDLVGPIVHGLIDEFADQGEADLVRQLFWPFPVHVIAGMLGLPAEELPAFHRRAVELISIAVEIDRGLVASQWLYDFFAGVISQRRADPREDLISVLVQAELDGQQLTDEEIIAFLRLLLPAGAETTYRSSSNLMFGLLSNPDQLDRLRADRSLMPAAIEEGLRWEPPLTGIGRTATRDVVVDGITIPAGAPISVCLGGANRDPSRWDDPDQFDFTREPKQHMAFAFGPHMCLGMHLARMETTVVINAVLDRLPDVRLDPGAEDPHITGLMFRAPRGLPVLFG